MADKKLFILPKKYKGDTAVVSTRLPSDMIKTLDHLAENTGRSRNEIIMMCLEFAMENLDTDNHTEKDG